MKFLLCAVNAKYIHSNPGLESLKAFAVSRDPSLKDQIRVLNFTINQYVPDILADIYKARPDVVAFSCYIWNIEMIKEIAELLHQLRPELPIWYGGPEVSYDAAAQLSSQPWLTGVMCGEGEETFYELCSHYTKGTMALAQIRGIAYSDASGAKVTAFRPELSMDEIPFIYEDMKNYENKIVYYETSRGCPFNCSYCLSSVSERVRLRSMDLVEKELQFFIDHRVPQVKFVDRTFNCNRAHALAIWRYIHTHDQGYTNFHFEVGADLLGDEELALLAAMRPGLVQLEIGVQSTAEATIKEVARTMDLDQLGKAVAHINENHNIHQHLDLIAGLPFEGIDRFIQSFNDVFAMAPEQLQLGFLKVLKGSEMHRKADEYGIVYQRRAPYEVLKTRWLSYDDILRLKGVEAVLELYYNSHQFEQSLRLLLHEYESPFVFFDDLAAYYATEGLDKVSQTRQQRYDILLAYSRDRGLKCQDLLKETCIYDLYARDNIKSRPVWAGEHSRYYDLCENLYRNETFLKTYLPEYVAKGYRPAQIKRMTHLEAYEMDLKASATAGYAVGQPQLLLFDYEHRDPLTREARVTAISLEEGQKLIASVRWQMR